MSCSNLLFILHFLPWGLLVFMLLHMIVISRVLCVLTVDKSEGQSQEVHTVTAVDVRDQREE